MKKAAIAMILLIAAYLLPCCVIYGYRSATDGYRLTPQDTIEQRQVYDLNTITAQQLQQIDGIGPAIANRIIEFRQTNGDFTSPEQLLQIDGIGPSTAAKILQYTTIGG